MAGHGKRIPDRLSYGNVVATLALFISLGGASYAVVTLPENGVGRRQLQYGAVTPGKLSFPLGTTRVSNDTLVTLVKTGCNSPGAPGAVRNVICPPRSAGWQAYPLVLHIEPGGPGHLAVFGIAGTHDTQAGSRAEVVYEVDLDRGLGPNRGGEGAVTVLGGQSEQVPVQALFRVPAGLHNVELQTKAYYSSDQPGDVIVGPVTLVAVLLP